MPRSQFIQMHQKISVRQIRPVIPERRRVISVVSRRQASRNAIMKRTILTTAKREYSLGIENDWYLRPHEKCIGQAVHDRKWFMPDYAILASTKVVSL